MKTMLRLTCIALVLAAVGVGYFLSSSFSSGAVARETTKASGTTPSAASAVLPGPHPRAVVDETVFEFGEMVTGEQRRHTFVVRNEGQAPLKLEQGKTTCKCTLGTVEESLIAPGESTTVILEWTPEEPARTFRQGAVIRTNDPQNQRLSFYVTGRVDDVFELIPAHTWSLGQIDSSRETTVTGRIFSRVREEFQIHDITSSDPGVLEGQAVPLPAAELARHEAKCGYLLTATLKPGLPSGHYRGSLTLETDLNDETQPALLVEGFVPGAIRIVGPHWSPDEMRLALGKFRASEGRRATLVIHVLDRQNFGDFRIVGQSVDHPHLTLNVAEDGDAPSDRHRVIRLAFEVPAGSPASVRPKDNPVKVTLATNHAELAELELTVSFVSY